MLPFSYIAFGYKCVANISGAAIQKTHYYPFGMAYAESSDQGKQPYKYNGKELDPTHGLNLYDYAARYHDSAYGRFTTMDPLAEKYYSISPYVYCNNNPLKYIDPTGMWYDDYFNEDGKYLRTDNSSTDKVRIMNKNTWDEKSNGDGTIDIKKGVANSALHSKSGITEKASLEIYKHYNPTNYNVKLNKSESDSYLMRFEAHFVGNETFETMIRVNSSRMNDSGRADDANDIVNLFIHENDHGQFLKDVGPALYLNATRSRSKIQPVENRAIKAQIAHPTWDKSTQGLRTGISNYANDLKILISGLNIAPLFKKTTSAPLDIKRKK